MSHALISVGCNRYEHAKDLSGAENDATRIFRLLTDPKHGDCDASRSAFVASPDFHEFRQEVFRIASQIGEGDVLTFFFAGHGVVKNGIFYICLRDTCPDLAGATAFPLSSLLSIIQEANPRHANILIDACNSGGVLGDFKRALSPDSVGDARTTGISLLAACAQDQFAYEEDGRGVFTSQVVGCIEGATFVQDGTSEIDLTEIAGVVAQKMALSEEQTPVFWGLNLTGRPNFCRNQHVSEDNPLRRVLAEAAPLSLSSTLKRRFQEIHMQLDDAWDAGKLRQAISEFFDQSSLSDTMRLSFSNQILHSLRIKARSVEDPFREIEVAAACLAPLLESCARSEAAEAFIVQECRVLADTVFEKTKSVLSSMEEDEFALLGETGFGEFYLLPVRISKLLGWLGWAQLVRRHFHDGSDSDLLRRLLDHVNLKYSGSLRSMSDVQAPYLIACCGAALGTSAHEQAEELVGYLLADAFETRGSIAAHDLDEEKLIEFLISRSEGDSLKQRYFANPSSLAFALIYVAALFNLDEAADSGFVELDHLNTNAFIPATYSAYFKDRIQDGCNVTIRIGHDAWSTEDFRSISAKIEWPVPESPAVSMLSGACSLVFPDRVAWHILDSSTP
jgi:hypothetical protein